MSRQYMFNPDFVITLDVFFLMNNHMTHTRTHMHNQIVVYI